MSQQHHIGPHVPPHMAPHTPRAPPYTSSPSHPNPIGPMPVPSRNPTGFRDEQSWVQQLAPPELPPDLIHAVDAADTFDSDGGRGGAGSFDSKEGGIVPLSAGSSCTTH